MFTRRRFLQAGAAAAGGLLIGTQRAWAEYRAPFLVPDKV